MKNLTELKKSLKICISCLVLAAISYILLPGYAGAIPGIMQGISISLVFCLAGACLYRVINDGLDDWATWAVFIFTIIIICIQLGYKVEAKANPFPSSYIQNTQKLC